MALFANHSVRNALKMFWFLLPKVYCVVAPMTCAFFLFRHHDCLESLPCPSDLSISKGEGKRAIRFSTEITFYITYIKSFLNRHLYEKAHMAPNITDFLKLIP